MSSVANARGEITMILFSKEANLVVVQVGAHFLTASHPEEVDRGLVEFMEKWANKHICPTPIMYRCLG